MVTQLLWLNKLKVSHEIHTSTSVTCKVMDSNLSTGFLLGSRRDGGAESQSLISVPNTPGLNPKSLRNAYDVKAYELLIAIHQTDGDVKPDEPLGAFRKE